MIEAHVRTNYLETSHFRSGSLHHQWPRTQREDEGYCYIDEEKPDALDVGVVVNHCRDERRRMLRFSGKNTPTKGAAALVVCLDEDAADF